MYFYENDGYFFVSECLSDNFICAHDVKNRITVFLVTTIYLCVNLTAFEMFALPLLI